MQKDMIYSHEILCYSHKNTIKFSLYLKNDIHFLSLIAQNKDLFLIFMKSEVTKKKFIPILKTKEHNIFLKFLLCFF